MRQQRKNATQSRRREKKKERKKITDLTRDLISFNLYLYRLLASLTVFFSRYFSLSFLFPSFPLFSLFLSLFAFSHSRATLPPVSNHSLPFTHRFLSFPISPVHSPPFSFPSTFFHIFFCSPRRRGRTSISHSVTLPLTFRIHMFACL